MRSTTRNLLTTLGIASVDLLTTRNLGVMKLTPSSHLKTSYIRRNRNTNASYLSNTSILLHEFIEQIKMNKPNCTKLILQSDQLANITDHEREELFMAIEENNTLTYMSISHNTISNDFTTGLIQSLRNNKSITKIEYDKENIDTKFTDEINGIIDRNRDIALTRDIKPIKLSLDIAEAARHLFYAVEHGDVNFLYTVLPEMPEMLKKTDSNERSLLHIAARYGQVDCIKLLLNLGAEVDYNPVNLKVNCGTALHQAVANGHFVITKLLLDAGASVTEKRNGYTPLHDTRDLDIAMLLVDKGAGVQAICGDDTLASHTSGFTVLHSTIYAKPTTPELLEYLLAQGANVNATDKLGYTPLALLASNRYQTPEGFKKRLDILIDAGANPLLKNNRGESIATFADPKWVEYISVATEAYIQCTDKIKTNSERRAARLH